MNRRGLLKLFGIAPLAAVAGKQVKEDSINESEIDGQKIRVSNCRFVNCKFIPSNGSGVPWDGKAIVSYTSSW